MKEFEEFEGIGDLLSLYQEIDEIIDAFIAETGTICPRSCGTCCATSTRNVEASVFEVMPLSLDLWEKGQAEEVLDRLGSMGDDDCCVFYRAEIPDGAPGHCSVHSLRPLICRLFGYWARFDKYGGFQNCICPKMTSPGPGDAVLKSVPLPVMTEFAIRAASMNPDHGAARIPLNRALAEAISIVGMKRAYRSGENGCR